MARCKRDRTIGRWMVVSVSFWLLPHAALPLIAQTTLPSMPPVLLQMIRDDAVHQDLGVTQEQREQIMEALRQVDGPWFRSRNLPAEQQRQQIDALTSQLETQLVKVLEPDQRTRLTQLICQALGTRMLLLEDTAANLGLSAATTKSLRDSFRANDEKVLELQRKLNAGELKPDSANRDIERVKVAERQQVVSVLSDKQKTKVGELTGQAFDFSRVQRTYPFAPELTEDGATWIQGGPLRLEQLRGKVVAIHFYAFQCINCQRNFPHYKSWHDTYADEGLVIIGIQTPETTTERQIERVVAAVKMDSMEYPVVHDEASSNWNAWSNTMWPTVCLVDKRGFIRHLWQGELNWQGNSGEQQMRKTIEQLLAESP